MSAPIFKCVGCGGKFHEPYCENGCSAEVREIETAPAYDGRGDDDQDDFNPDDYA